MELKRNKGNFLRIKYMKINRIYIRYVLYVGGRSSVVGCGTVLQDGMAAGSRSDEVIECSR
jgi:hypothetical protein